MTYEIKYGKNKFVYDLNGMRFGRRNTAEERRQLVLDIVEKFPDIQHTHILKIADHVAKIPKKTIENTLSKLENEEILESIKHGKKQNDKRTWKKRTRFLISQKELLKDLQGNMNDLEKQFHHTIRIIAKKRLPKKIKSRVCLDFLQILIYYEWHWHHVFLLYRSPQILNMLDRIREIRKGLSTAMFPYDGIMNGRKDSVSNQLLNNASNAEDELTEFIKKIKVTNNQIDFDFFTTEYTPELRKSSS